MKALSVCVALVAIALVILAIDSRNPTRVANAVPGTVVASLLSCPNVDASADNKVAVGDILGVVQAYFNDWPAADYYYLYDLVAPYNAETGQGGKGRVDDILGVVNRYFEICPAVDTEVAKASRWVIVQHPELVTENESMLAGLGYLRASQNVPGQGVHYVNLSAWDANFDPQAPEGLVYGSNGRLAAQLYVLNGDNVGWIEDPNSTTPGACWDGIDNGGDGPTDAADGDCGNLIDPQGAPPDDVDIGPLVHNCPSTCGWPGQEGWHIHYRFCMFHIGRPNATSIAMAPGSTASSCQTLNNSGCSGGCGTSDFRLKAGWMIHLWNHLPNANLIPDVNATMNGRFADCHPDGGIWEAFNCPQ